MKWLGLVIVAAFAMATHAATYKWVDSEGRVQYSDTPPPPNAKRVEERKIVPSMIGTAGLPYSVQEAVKRNPVTLWMHDCGDLCNKARDYLARRGVPYSLRNPARMDEQVAWKSASGGDSSVPRLIVGSAYSLKGFDESEWAAALDAAGYPRSAPAMKPTAIPPADTPTGEKPVSKPQAQSPAPTK